MPDVSYTTKKRMHPVAAGAAGVVIGAAGAAVTAALMHEPTRKKMRKKMHEAQMKVEKTVKDLQSSSKPILKKAQDKIKELTSEMPEEN